MRTTLAKLFTLKPYGKNLLDGVGETWILLAALNILAIAFCDAVAWGYFAYTTTTGVAAYIAAAVAGAIVLMLVGSVDAMFVMYDRTRPQAITRESAAPDGLLQRLRTRIHRDHIAVVARVVLVVLTFTITAPFLTQLFFARDIDASIERRNEQTISSRRQQLASAFDARMNEDRVRLGERQRDLEREIAGSGSSGRYGKGPTATAIEREIGTLEQRISTTEASKMSELQTFDRAVGSPEVLANRYGVDLVRQGPDTRARVIEELEQSPSFRTTRRNIKAFLVFMFLGLVCLKLFQPESVRIYYSARLQAAYARMQMGLFNHRLDAREQPQAGGMNPIRFADWYENDQHVRDMTDRLRDQTACAIERLKAQEEALHVLNETLRTDIARMQQELAATSRDRDELEQEVVTQQGALAALQARIAEEQQALDDFRYDLTNDLPLQDQQLLISSRNRTARNLGEHRSAAAALAATVTRLHARLDSSRGSEARLRESLAAAGSEAAALTSALQQARQRRAADILAAS